MEPQAYLRFEGGAELLGLLIVYFTVIDGPIWLFLVLILVPDLSMLGYLVDTRVGSITYNAFHIYPLPVLLGAIGITVAGSLLVSVAIIWGTHIALDRTVGYGLKYPTGFKPTHLQPRSERFPDPHSIQ